MNKIFIHQIFYNAETRAGVAPEFIPLDNEKNEHPDWFEFWVMLNFLRSNSLEEDAWYGFLSPKFEGKAGVAPSLVIKTLETYGEKAEVALFSPGWDQLAYFVNPWEQGDAWHPGIMAASQEFLNQAGIKVDLKNLVATSKTGVFSNYIIAKKRFWTEWQKLAEKFFELAESEKTPSFLGTTSYGSRENQFPMKTFIQERFATLILASSNFNTLVVDQSTKGVIYQRMFPTDKHTRRLLQTCDLMKTRFRETADRTYLDMFWKIRKSIKYTDPGM